MKYKKFLSKVYLRKTIYKIKNQIVEQSDMPLEAPQNVIKTIQNFESGQVYEIVFKDIFSDRYFTLEEVVKDRIKSKNSSQLSSQQKGAQSQKNSLVYLESLRQDINGEEHFLTFFKDITFGILYEQIKLQENLRNVINNTIQKKVTAPMETVIKSCVHFKQSRELKLFEQYQVKNNNLGDQLNNVIIQSKQMISRLNDMQDWDLLLTGQFKKRKKSFNLQHKLKEIE